VEPGRLTSRLPGRTRSAERRLRRRYAAAAASFAHLGDDVLEAFFANFGFAAPLALLSDLDALCRRLRPGAVAEIGSGVSTAVLARALEPGAALLSIDQDLGYAARAAELAGPGAAVVFVCAADASELERMACDSWRAELVLVDGPAGADRFAEPLASLHRRLLSPEAVCVVDDTDRPENDRGASALAGELGLRRVDRGDPIYTSHRYSILFPPTLDGEINA
jgi:hypothetical protein